ncbi:unnamed protein product [Arabidopsis thaliana]|uniref:Uncharacterized protein n=1 Tax=Arabidopsis thaliana TaxID=3702 RepID=A0A5S9WWY7_ARATH|nr:unnamed protein product [Arabidopsis thaliana]
MELYNKIYGALIFDVYHEDEEQIFDVSDDTDDNLAILVFEEGPSNKDFHTLSLLFFGIYYYYKGGERL